MEKNMSQSLFDATADLIQPRADGSQTEPIAEGPQTLRASGFIGDDDEEREVYVFVTIQQTPADRGESAPAPDDLAAKAAAVAIATSQGNREPFKVPAHSTTTKWSAEMTPLPNHAPFKLDCPATGTALTVEYSDDPAGFETYIWTERILLERPG
jgi:hypothetical protein